MVGTVLKLASGVVMLPARLGVRVVRSIVEDLLGGAAEPQPTGPAEEASVPTPPSPEAPAPPARARRPSADTGARRRPRPKPTHVSEEPELVIQSAGATADAVPGPEVRVEEPWEGYDRMKAADVRQRLVGADSEVAAAVRLYEGLRKKRTTVIRAADEQLGA